MAYPASLDSFTTKTDDVTEVLAAHVNDMQTAIVAIETELGTDPAGTLTDVKTRLAAAMGNTGYIKHGPGTTLTISSGAITITGNYHKVETESGAASDDLATITGGAAGQFLYLLTVNDARDVVIKHGTGNIYCMGAKDITLSTSYEMAQLIYDTTNTRWVAAKCPPGYSLVGNISGAGTIATGGFTLTVPATGTAALLGTANTFTAANQFTQVYKVGTFAEIHTHDASTAQAIATGATYTKLTAFTNNGFSANCTADYANDKITITKAGIYKVNATVSFSGESVSVIWFLSPFLDGTEQDMIHASRKIGTGGDVGNISMSGFIDVASVPVDLDLRARHDQGGNENLTISYANLNCEYIGDT